jgi:hypothetical protein
MGPIGLQGHTGATGVQGPTGVTGPKGPTGGIGSTGPRGRTGEKGSTGPVGKPLPQISFSDMSFEGKCNNSSQKWEERIFNTYSPSKLPNFISIKQEDEIKEFTVTQSGQYLIEGYMCVFSTGKTTLSIHNQFPLNSRYVNCANVICPDNTGQIIAFKISEYIPEGTVLKFVQYSENVSIYGMGLPDFSRTSMARNSSVTITKLE